VSFVNREEAAKVIAILQVNYPDSFRDKSADAMRGTVALWADIFQDDPYELVMAAVKAHMAMDDNRFMPTVGAIKKAIRRLLEPEQMTEGEAWALVKKALVGSSHRARENFAALPPTIQKAVGGSSVLRDWGQMPLESLGVIQSNFQRAYRAKVKAEEEQAALPSALREIAGRLTAGMNRLESGD